MKKFLIFSLFLGLVFIGSYLAPRWIEMPWPKLPAEKISAPVARFQPTPFPLINHPFTIVIVGVNNGAFVSKTLASVFRQNYDNYKVIYIDDASSDGSADLAHDLVYQSDHLLQVTFVQNEERLGMLANLFRAVQSCADGEIVVVLHGEDWLAHEWVLQRLNAYYANPDLWLTYGQYCDFPTYHTGICHPYSDAKFRTQPFLASHLKTFYAGLFKKIREGDFIYAGKFLPACADLAAMIPMLEMAKDHFSFVPEVLYINNQQTACREDRELQAQCERFVRGLDSYSPLPALQVQPCGE